MTSVEPIRGLQAARPAVSIAGEADSSLTEGLLSLMVQENVSGIYRCEAEFGNWGPVDGSIGFLYFDRAKVEFGKAFEIRIDDDTLFEGKITGIEAHFSGTRPPTVTVLAEDRLQDLRMTRRTRTFSDVTDADITEQIASAHGLSTEVDFQGPTHRAVAQVNQSDLAFLQLRGARLGVEVWVSGSTLYAKKRTGRAETQSDLAFGADLKEFNVLADLAHQRTAVLVNGWDVAAKEKISEEATESAVQAELEGGDSGATILSETFSERKESIAHTVPVTGETAREFAAAAFQALARRFVVGRGTLTAAAKLHVGQAVNLTGLGPMFSGKYYVSELTHLFDGVRGMRTEFVGERPSLGRA